MVKINDLDDGKIEVISPYNASFVKKARMLKGNWNGKGWEFKKEYEDIIKGHLMDIYGDDGSPTPKCIVRVNLSKLSDINYNKIWDDEVRMFGRTLVIRQHKNLTPLLDKTVILVEGGFSNSGGSRNNPNLKFYDNTILQIEDVPEHLYVKLLNEYNLTYDNDIVYRVDNKNNIDKLKEEKERLLKRLSEIDNILNNQ